MKKPNELTFGETRDASSPHFTFLVKTENDKSVYQKEIAPDVATFCGNSHILD